MRWCSIFLLSAALILMDSKGANATNWKNIWQDHLGTSYADIDSKKTVNHGEYKSIWIRTEFKKNQTYNGKQYKTTETLIYSNCDNHEMATKAVYAYKNSNAAGSPAFSFTNMDALLTFEATPPDSFGDTVINLTCKNN